MYFIHYISWTSSNYKLFTGITKSYVIESVTLAKTPRLFGSVSSTTQEDFETNGL